MKTLIGLILFTIGGAVMLYGGFLAVRELAGLYQSALNAPLDQPPGAEKNASEAMLQGVLIGAVGVVPFLIGSIMLKAALFGKMRRALR